MSDDLDSWSVDDLRRGAAQLLEEIATANRLLTDPPAAKRVRHLAAIIDQLARRAEARSVGRPRNVGRTNKEEKVPVCLECGQPKEDPERTFCEYCDVGR